MEHMSETDQPDAPPEKFIYMNSLAWIAGWVKRTANDSEFSEEQIEAQVGLDLRRILDHDWKAH